MNSENLFSKRFAKLIDIIGASKKNIAEILGVSPSYITQLTTKIDKDPSPSLVRLIAMTFGISEKWLTGEIDKHLIFGDQSISQSEYEAQLAHLRIKYKNLNELRGIASSLHAGADTVPDVKKDPISPKTPPARLSELNNLQREWIDIGLKMGDLEMLEWLVKIKKGHQ